MNIHDVYRPFLRYFRTRRMRVFVEQFKVSDASRIVDVGGSPFNWSLIGQKPDITLVNVNVQDWDDGRMRMLCYDGKVLPFADHAFDLCYSNSVIEHVGDWSDIQRFAREIRRMAPAYYIQTPNRNFFIEPHFICAFVHWLPFGLRRKMIRYASVWGWVTKPSQQDIDNALSGIRLLNVSEMKVLFPDAVIMRERFLGMTKSIIACKVPG